MPRTRTRIRCNKFPSNSTKGVAVRLPVFTSGFDFWKNEKSLNFEDLIFDCKMGVQDVYDVVFVMEGTANMGMYFDGIKQNYIMPTLE